MNIIKLNVVFCLNTRLLTDTSQLTCFALTVPLPFCLGHFICLDQVQHLEQKAIRYVERLHLNRVDSEKERNVIESKLLILTFQ